MSAVLLPFTPDGDIDWRATEAHIARTVQAGLTPAVNMDTGYVQLLDQADKHRVLDLAADVTGGRLRRRRVRRRCRRVTLRPATATSRRMRRVADRGGTPVVFPSHGLNSLDDDGWVAAHAAIGAEVDRFIGFELGAMFVPYGRIPSLDAYGAARRSPRASGPSTRR